MKDQSLGPQLPLTLEEGRGRSQGLFRGGGNKQPPLHLAAGSWDRGQEGPICRLQSCQFLRAGRAGVGDGGQLSGLGLLRPRWEWGPLEEGGKLGWFFLRFLIFFHFLNKHEYIYIFFFYKTFVELGGWEVGGQRPGLPASLVIKVLTQEEVGSQVLVFFTSEVGLDHQALWEAQGFQLQEDGWA